MTFEALYQRTNKLVAHKLAAMGFSRDAIEEISQETYLRALQSFERFVANPDHPEGSLVKWILMIAHNTAISYSRKEGIRRHTELTELNGGSRDGIADTYAKKDQVRRVLKQLSPRFRQVAELLQQGYSNREIGDMLGRPQRTITTRKHRIRHAFFVDEKLIDPSFQPPEFMRGGGYARRQTRKYKFRGEGPMKSYLTP